MGGKRMTASIDIISLQINSDLHEWLQDEARHHNTTVNKLITEAIRGYYRDELCGEGKEPTPPRDWRSAQTDE